MVTLTDAEIMAGIRVSADTAGLSGEGETAILITDNDMGALIPARAAYARVEIDAAAPDAPDEASNAAALALVGYLYDAPPSKVGNAWERSGCAYILRRWLVRRAVAVFEATA